MMRGKSIIAQERLKGSILSFYLKLERQMSHSPCLPCSSSAKEVEHYVRPKEGCSSRPPLSHLHPLMHLPPSLPPESHWACCSEMTQLLLVQIALWQWFFPVSKSTRALVTLMISEGKIKKVNIGVLVFSLKPRANVRYSPLYFWVLVLLHHFDR